MTHPISASHRVVCSEHHRPLQRGINAPSSPRSSSVRGLFVPVSKDFLVRFRLPRGISETNSQNFQDFLATGELFFKNVARILAGVKGFGLPPHPGGGLVSCRFLSCRGPAWSRFRPCLRPVRQSETGQNVRPSPVPCVGLSPCKWTTILYRAGKWLYGPKMGLCGAIV